MTGPQLTVLMEGYLYMQKKMITVIVYPSEDGYVAYMPLFPSCITQGDSVEDAFRKAKECLELALYEPDEFDLWALDAYSENVVVGTVEIDFPVTPGPDWRFGEDARRHLDEMWEKEDAEAAKAAED